MTCEEAKAALQNIRDNAEGLTEWEAEFCEGLSQKLEQYGDDPSPKRIAIIEKITRERIPTA